MMFENKIDALIGRFDPISLDEMDQVRLMRRVDSKYVFPLHQLPALLEKAANDFRMVEIAGFREQIYETTYFDTPDLKMYHIHHNGKRNRHKVRLRRYIYSKQEYLEVKRKNNKGETIKSRINNNPDIGFLNSGVSSTFLQKAVPYPPQQLIPVMGNRFIRLTLVDKMFRERITIDYDLSFINLLNSSEVSYQGLCIAEVKCNRDDRRSNFIALINQLKINQTGFSKYCVGMARLNDRIKNNLFKPKLRMLDKMDRVAKKQIEILYENGTLRN